ncbi:restriction endonuclease subunit S [Bacteroides fragilis]|uniref:restriction endonuclease subunit S n=1 Tax=Bacteroides fragilis TaxID=817 RepID=UPI0024582A66|nr:restriction endonuclease subunit S [Bacteroides fragilis]
MNSYYEKFIATGEVKCIDEEIPFEIPQGWEWTRIGNIFNHTSGKQQSSSNKNSGTPQKFITTSNLYWGYFVLDNVKIMNFTEEEIRTCSATKGDLLVCEGGAGYGRSAIWNEDYDICLQNHVHRLRPCISGICEYVYHFIYLLKESNNLASVGTAMPGLSANRLKGLLLPLPPLSEQRRIVAKLGELLPQVEKYSKVQSYLDELNVSINDKLKKSILQEAIQGKLVPQITREGTAQELLEQIRQEKQRLTKEGKLKKSALTDSVIYKGDDNKYYERVDKSEIDISDEIPFEIPQSWSWCRLSSVITLLSGRDLTPDRYNSKENGIPYITGASNFYNGNLLINRWTESPMTVSHFNDLLITCKGTIGEMAFNRIGSIHIARQIMALTGIVGDLDYIRWFLYANISSIERQANSMIPGISRDTLLKTLLPLPPKLEQRRINDKIVRLLDELK